MPARRAASGHRSRPVHPGGHAGALQPLRQDPALQRSRAGRGHPSGGHRPARSHPQGGGRRRTPARRRCGRHRPGLRAGMPRPGGRLPGLAAGPPLCDPQAGRHHGRAHRHPYRPLPLDQQRGVARPGASPACRHRPCRGRRAGGRRHLPGRQSLPHGPHPRRDGGAAAPGLRADLAPAQSGGRHPSAQGASRSGRLPLLACCGGFHGGPRPAPDGRAGAGPGPRAARLS